jgi:hypothetical protein
MSDINCIDNGVGSNDLIGLDMFGDIIRFSF